MGKKASSVLAVAAAATVLLASCRGGGSGGGDGAPASPGTGKVRSFTVTIRHIQIGEAQKFRKAILDDVVRKTEQEVPGLKFELDGVEDNINRFTKLPAEMAAGDPPEIMDIFGGAGDTQKYARAGRLLDLTPILDELGLKDQFLNVLEPFSVDGKVYGLPIGGNAEGIFYNTDLFARYGLPPPTTWNNLIRAAETLKQHGIVPFAAGSKEPWVPNMLINTLIARTAGDNAFAGFLTGASQWNSPDVVAAYRLFSDWEHQGYFPQDELGEEYTDMLADFVAGKTGMMFDGSWRSSTFRDDAVGNPIAGKVAFVSLPPVPDGKGDQTSVNANYGEGYGFSADLNENELRAVKAFIRNMYSDEMQLRGLLEDGVLPSMKLSDESIARVTDPVVKQVLAVLKNAGSTFPHFDSVVQSKVYAETETQLTNLIAGRATPQQVGDAIQRVQDAENAASAP